MLRALACVASVAVLSGEAVPLEVIIHRATRAPLLVSLVRRDRWCCSDLGLPPFQKASVQPSTKLLSQSGAVLFTSSGNTVRPCDNIQRLSLRDAYQTDPVKEESAAVAQDAEFLRQWGGKGEVNEVGRPKPRDKEI